MRKVLMIGLTGGVGGVETFMCNVYQHINQEEYQIDFLIHQEINKRYKKIINQGSGNIYYVTGIKKGVFTYLKNLFDFFKENSDYDIVHLNECSAIYFIYAFPCIFYRNMKLIVHSHNGDSRNIILHKILKFIQNRFIWKRWACSEVAAQWMFDKKNISEKNYTIIHNGIDLEQYRYNEDIRIQYRKHFGLENNIVLGSIARFEYQKNHEFIINLFEGFYHTNNNARLLLVGGGESMNYIKKIVSDKGLDSVVIFLGVRDDISKLLQMLDVFLLPSYFEGLPFVTIEAQASGLPILASNNVSEEIKITDLVIRKSLDDRLEDWIECLNKLIISGKNRGDKIYCDQLRDCGYDIKQVVQFIEEQYKG